MPKRLAIDLPRDPFTERPRRKKPKTFWLGAQSWRYYQSTSRPRPQTTFLDLPLELRDLIYHDALEDLTATLLHPWDELPKHARFKTYRNLRLANRQVGVEIKNIFKKHYESGMVFFFDNPPDLWDLWRQTKWHPRLRKAKFYLRCINHDEDYYERLWRCNYMRNESEKLFRTQDVVKNIVAAIPSIYDHRRDRIWNPDETGFKVIKDSHCSCADSSLCKKYEEIIWPPHTRSASLCVRTFLWTAIFKNHKRPRRCRIYPVGSWVLEGELCDIKWSHYDLDYGRNTVSTYRRRAKPAVSEQLTILRVAGKPEELVDDLLSSDHSTSDSSDSDSSETDDSDSESSDDSSSSSEDDEMFSGLPTYNFSRENLCPGDIYSLDSDDSESSSNSSSENDSSEDADDESGNSLSDDSDSSSDTDSSDDSDSSEG